MNGFFLRATKQTFLSALVCTVYSLAALSLFAVFVRAYAPGDMTICIVNQIIRCTGIFVCALLFVHGERAFFKGMASGLLSTFVTMLLFGIIGGFHLSALFLLELVLGALFGALGALCSKKLRKE